MSIYDEAFNDLLKYFHENKPLENIDDTLVKIEHGLERAKKEHELLELYRKHMNTLCKKDRDGVKNSLFSSEFVAFEVYQQIQALEEELK